MKNKNLKNILTFALKQNIKEFRQTLKNVLGQKIQKRLDEKEQEVAKKLFKDGKN